MLERDPRVFEEKRFNIRPTEMDGDLVVKLFKRLWKQWHASRDNEIILKRRNQRGILLGILC